MEYNHPAMETKVRLTPGQGDLAPARSGADPAAYGESIQQILADNVGNLCRIEFLIGTQNLVAKEGYIYYAGRSYVVLYNQRDQTYHVCDVFSVRFVTFPVPPEFQPQSDPSSLPGFTEAGPHAHPSFQGAFMQTPDAQGRHIGGAEHSTVPYAYPTDDSDAPYHPGNLR